MPPSVVQSISSASRRSTGPNRQRENRPYNQQGSMSVRRRKSRSPDTRAGDDATLQSDSHTRRYNIEILPFSIRAKGYTVFSFAVTLSLIFNQ